MDAWLDAAVRGPHAAAGAALVASSTEAKGTAVTVVTAASVPQQQQEHEQEEALELPVPVELSCLTQGLRVSVNDVQLELFESIGEGSFGTVYRGGGDGVWA
jgi:hypothetical protein